MNKRFALFALLLIFPMVLAACGGSDMEPADAEKGIEAAFAGNFEEAEKYMCDEELDEMRNDPNFTSATEGMELTADATCRKDGDAMVCDVAMSAVMAEGQEPTDLGSTELRANIKDGKLCGEAE